MLDFESVININCKIESTKIHYFLSIPIDFEKDFDLYYLHPIPTRYESEFATIIPDIKYLLKSNDNTIKPLSDICTQGKIFQCPSHLQTNHRSTCEEQIVREGNSQQCRYTRLQIRDNHMEIIPEINQYLAVFPQQEEIQIKCQQETETKVLMGIYLLKEENCKIIYKQQEISYQDKTYGTPLVINKPQLTLTTDEMPDFKIQLKTLNLKGISSNPIIPITEEPFEYHKPSLWTVLIYIILVALGLYYLTKWLRNRKDRKNNRPEIKIELQQRKLPEEASF